MVIIAIFFKVMAASSFNVAKASCLQIAIKSAVVTRHLLVCQN